MPGSDDSAAENASVALVEKRDDLEKRLKRIQQSRRKIAEEVLDLYQKGEIESEESSFFSGLAGDYEELGVFAIYDDDIGAAQTAFTEAATYYQRSSDKDPIPLHSARQRMQGMYAALLAGEEATLVDLAESMQRLAAEEDCDPSDEWADRYFLAWCLAGAVLGTVDEAALMGLEAVNDEKLSPHAAYGQAILSIARGVCEEDPAAIESGIESMLAFHEQDMQQDNVVEQVMSVQATALLILARAAGYRPAVSSEFIPIDLVEASADAIEP
ncbi:Imm49 family immunity protein [Haloarcula sebkhae]|uniref:Imm49 family immunity protein n=2 Tax=Haloarcula sebkhae TaxID=932660 RepID=A0ACC6VRD5_9EURY|nr:Imm49 family immunity protein [Haloarcula sebkhae]GGK85070.1 hypothetical protein GCM10009067_41490 [Haloarcula sebkhae]